MVTGYQPESRKRVFWLGLGIVLAVALVAVAWVAWGVQSREREFEANLEKRLALAAAANVRLFDALTQLTRQQANRVINSDLFRLYASEVDLVQDDVSRLVAGPLPGQPVPGENLRQLSDQLPMMQNLLIEFTRISGYLSGRIVNRNGTVYLATDAATTPLRPDQMALVETVLESQEATFGPLRNSDNGLVLEAYLPIFPPEASGLVNRPVAVLVLGKVVNEQISQMRSSGLLEKGERMRLLQKAASGYQEVVPWLPDPLPAVGESLPLDARGRLPFAVRPALAGAGQVYSLGLPVPELHWLAVAEADYRVVREGLRDQNRALIFIAGLVVLVSAVALGAVWAGLIGYQCQWSLKISPFRSLKNSPLGVIPWPPAWTGGRL